MTANSELIKNARFIAASINVHSSFQDWEAAEKDTLEKCADALEAADDQIEILQNQIKAYKEVRQMPNWIEGTLKLRGSSENLKRFFDNAIQPCFSYNPKMQRREDFITCNYGEDNEFNEASIKPDAYIENTSRAFVNDECYIYWEKAYETVCIPIRQAWAFVTEDWIWISKQYNLDVRLYGFEQGMEFCQEVEIIDGKVTMDNKIKYDDWDWECPMPRMGG